MNKCDFIKVSVQDKFQKLNLDNRVDLIHSSLNSDTVECINCAMFGEEFFTTLNKAGINNAYAVVDDKFLEEYGEIVMKVSTPLHPLIKREFLISADEPFSDVQYNVVIEAIRKVRVTPLSYPCYIINSRGKHQIVKD